MNFTKPLFERCRYIANVEKLVYFVLNFCLEKFKEKVGHSSTEANTKYYRSQFERYAINCVNHQFDAEFQERTYLFN